MSDSWPANRPRFSDIMRQAQQLDDDLAREGYDDDTINDAIESETDLMRVVDRVMRRAIQDDRLAASTAERAKRFKARADKSRAFLHYILTSLDRSKIERPVGTAYLQNNPPGVDILGEVPPEYRRETHDSAAILKALNEGKTVENARLKPAATHVRILTT